MVLTKKCIICQQVFTPSKHNQKFCSKECKDKFYNRISTFPHLPSATVGTIGELVVATDLLKKGYEVYRPLSPSCSADLLVEKEQKIFKIEIRTGYIQKDGKLVYSHINIRASILAIVVHSENKIYYFEYPSNKEINF